MERYDMTQIRKLALSGLIYICFVALTVQKSVSWSDDVEVWEYLVLASSLEYEVRSSFYPLHSSDELVELTTPSGSHSRLLPLT